jgi:hypothetical protein
MQLPNSLSHPGPIMRETTLYSIVTLIGTKYGFIQISKQLVSQLKFKQYFPFIF